MNILKKKYNFSSQYASFLRTQNGLRGIDAIQAEDPQGKYFKLSESESTEPRETIQILYGVHSGDDYSDFEANNSFAEDPLKHFFTYIGNDPGGNPFAEIRRGKHKGRIVMIDHEIAPHDMDGLIEELKISMDTGSVDLNDETCLEKITEAIEDEEWGLVMVMADDFDSFLSLLRYTPDGVSVIENNET
ncbi:hypothetical protein [Breznakiella homolactica]|uniref:hypothetical protein n=1 Tax=Breznakiella homolactica TaxID=2798577 RepID=UPI001CBA647D|nr:hypothetical protein [Breznakiella homolactica]